MQDPCDTDADGFCRTHGNDCADYQLYLAEGEGTGPDADQEDPAETVVPTEMTSDQAIAFLCDSRASVLCLVETIEMLLAGHDVQRAYLELSSEAGRTIARTLLDHQVPFGVLSFGQPDLGPEHQDLVGSASELVQLDPGSFHLLKAQLAIVPAMVGSGEDHVDAAMGGSNIDLSPNTLPGAVLELAQANSRTLLMVDTPERGLVQTADGRYLRRVIVIGEAVSSTGS